MNISLFSFRPVGVNAERVTINFRPSKDKVIRINGRNPVDFFDAPYGPRDYFGRIEDYGVEVTVSPYEDGDGVVRYRLPISVGISAILTKTKLFNADKFIIAGGTCDGFVEDTRGAVSALELATKEGMGCIFSQRSATMALCAYPGKMVFYASNTRDVLGILSDASNDKLFNFIQPFDATISEYDFVCCDDATLKALQIVAAGGHPVLMNETLGSQFGALLGSILPDNEEDMIYAQKIASLAKDYVARKHVMVDTACGEPKDRLVGRFSYVSGLIPGRIASAYDGTFVFWNIYNVEYEESFNDVIKAFKEKKVVVKDTSYGEEPRVAEFKAKFIPVFSANGISKERIAEYDSIFDFCTVQYKVNYEAWYTNRSYMQNEVREKVAKARDMQMQRQGCLNEELSEDLLIGYLSPDESVIDDLRKTASSILLDRNINERGLMKVLRIARTIADLRGSEWVGFDDVIKAADFYTLDKKD